MADKRLKCICTKDSHGTIIQHTVLYSVSSGSNKSQLAIVVKASEMTTPSDMNELKTKADAKAVTAKATWVSKLGTQPIQVVDTTVAGDVSL